MVARLMSSRMNLEAFPGDLALPQVRIASDASQMREIFRKYLRPCNGNAYHIRDCILTRIRHRPTARCILQYSLRLEDCQSGREQILWASGVTYPSGRAEHIWKKLRAAGLAQQISGAAQPFEPVSFVPELKMLVQLFPYDHRLPALTQMMTGLSPEVESLFLAQFGPGKWEIETWNVEPIRYRTGLAAVMQYKVQAREKQTSKATERRFYAKVYRDEKGEEIYEVLKALWDRNEIIGEHFNVGKPIAYLSDQRVVFQEEALGVSFQEILIKGPDHEAISAARKIARALAALHLDNIPTTRRHLLQDEIAVLETRGRTLAWACPQLRNDIQAVVHGVVSSLGEVPLRPAHLDFKTDHILLDGDRYSLLDFDSFALADPVLDAAHALAQVNGIRFRFPVSQDRLLRTAEAFSDEYFAHVPGDWRSRLRPHYAGAMLKVAVGFFRRQEPEWSEIVSSLVIEARASLAANPGFRNQERSPQ